MRRLLVVVIAFAVVGVLSASAVATKRPPNQHVTIFGDSEAAAFDWVPQARQELEKGNRVLYQLKPCGRLTTPGCINPPPPSVLSQVRELGHRLGPTVIILVGYNDDPHQYADGIDSVLRALRNRGVKQVLWLTLRANAHPDQYRTTNSVIRVAAHRWPFMTVVNWGAYSAPHNEWFTDGIHFTSSGAVQFATYLHRTLRSYGLTGPKNPNAG
jgi:hypothetical protein